VKTLNIGLFGLGTVGTGVLELLQENQAVLEQRTGVRLRVTKAVVYNLNKPREVSLEGIEVSDDPSFILDDPTIDIVLELIGGTDLAKTIVLKTLDQGKILVTANKALLAEEGPEVFRYAAEHKSTFGFEAAVAGSIPVIRALREGLAGDQIKEMSGIINGTGNYILTSMTKKGETFDQALAKAQELGFAEADPTFDVEGIDTAHKLTLLMDIAFGGLFDFRSVYTEGITKIEPIDIEIAGDFGYEIKLLGKAKAGDKGIEGRVHPTLVPKSQMLASVDGAFNAVQIDGNYSGPIVLSGQGAGAKPTASAVVADLVEHVRNSLVEHPTVPLLSVFGEQIPDLEILDIGETVCPYYLRLEVDDKSGVLAKITEILGQYNISIASMVQRSRSSNGAPVSVVFFTHAALEKEVQQALSEISNLDFIFSPAKLIRVDQTEDRL